MNSAPQNTGRDGTLLGNALIMLLLAGAATALLRLHTDAWWVASPRPQQWWLAGAVLAAYLLACALVLRPRRSAATAAFASDDEPPVLVAWASQTGFASALAERSAAALREGGQQVLVLPLDQVDATRLAATRRALFIASTTGEGDPPDHALRFLRGAMAGQASLPHLHYALLALGDHEYADFCAFGRQLDGWLRARGARALFDRVEVDNADEAALRHWQYELGRIGAASHLADWAPPAYQAWQLAGRELLNPGSRGGPACHLRILPPAGISASWQAGDIAEIGPRNPPQAVDALLQRLGLDGRLVVPTATGDMHLVDLLGRSQLPDDAAGLAGTDAIDLAGRLRPLPHREYSIASIPEDGEVHLLVRLMEHADGTPGLGSGWLCRHAAPGATIDLRLRSNPGFHAPPHERPLVLIGNGTGMAGLRAHLRARVAAGARRNWLLFGERNAACDLFFGDELRAMEQEGWLQRLDLAFSRDEGDRAYVQDRLLAAAGTLRQWIDDGACVLVCGNATGMAPAVDAALANILGEDLREQLRVDGRYRRDVY